MMKTRLVNVTGHIGEYTQGQELVTEGDIAKYLRTVLNEGAVEESTLTDEELLTAFRAAYDAEDKWDEDIEIDFIQSMEM